MLAAQTANFVFTLIIFVKVTDRFESWNSRVSLKDIGLSRSHREPLLQHLHRRSLYHPLPCDDLSLSLTTLSFFQACLPLMHLKRSVVFTSVDGGMSPNQGRINSRLCPMEEISKFHLPELPHAHHQRVSSPFTWVRFFRKHPSLIIWETAMLLWCDLVSWNFWAHHLWGIHFSFSCRSIR